MIRIQITDQHALTSEAPNINAPLNDHMNRHEHCGGFFEKHTISETHHRHVCKRCGFFFEVPKEINTLEKSKKYFEENLKLKAKRLHYLIKDKKKGLIETGKYLDLGLELGESLTINSAKFREMINDQLGLKIGENEYFKTKNEEITFRFNNGFTTVTNGDNSSLLIQANEPLFGEERTLLTGETLKFRGISFRISE